MKLTIIICVLGLFVLGGCTSKEDGSALLAAADLQKQEFESLANAFASITTQSQMSPENKAKILDRIAESRGNYSKLAQAVQMLIMQMTEVDFRTLVPEADYFLDRYLPAPAPLPDRTAQN